MKPVTQVAKEYLSPFLSHGDIVVDATAGNGHDTLFLADKVGPDGHVFAFDIQLAAIEKTKENLTLANLLSRVTLINGSHAHMDEYIPQYHHGEIKLAMFNLGYLPGSSKEVITTPESTVDAVTKAFALLKNGGKLSIAYYTGHPGGKEEFEKLMLAVKGFHNAQMEHFPGAEGHRNPPGLIVLTKKS